MSKMNHLDYMYTYLDWINHILLDSCHLRRFSQVVMNELIIAKRKYLWHKARWEGSGCDVQNVESY